MLFPWSAVARHSPPFKFRDAYRLLKTNELRIGFPAEVLRIIEAQLFLNGGQRRAAALQGYAAAF